ncbi:hypothetical protein [Aeromonas dhakensis]|uniref:hypothetical protein n=1 Tax=Aeromonas dhakensis TaxID=196024 RepID=UPI001BFC0C57|nr:hypothetical protein [Aeromonas dhakensis]HDT5889082.1 hypothetical protein [Aeromonas dhakensis]HEB4976600.1 hypothetical protein [Aeromonas dhakensis]
MQDIIEKLRSSRNKSELFLIKREIERQLDELSKQKIKVEEDFSLLEESKINASKYIEYYSQAYASFYNTTLEKDKSILTLSVAGLGFLITFANLNVKLGCVTYAAFILAALAYLYSIYNIITILGENAKYIIEITTDSGKEVEVETQLKKYDKRAINSFYIGIILSLVLGIVTSFQSQLKKENVVAEEKKENVDFKNLQVSVESYGGISALKPTKPTPSTQNTSQNTKENANEEKK